MENGAPEGTNVCIVSPEFRWVSFFKVKLESFGPCCMALATVHQYPQQTPGTSAVHVVGVST